MAEDDKRDSTHSLAGTGKRDSWGSAAVRAGGVLVACFVALVLVPDRLLAYLSPRVTPASRDLVVVAWITVAFVALCWMFVALQRRRR